MLSLVARRSGQALARQQSPALQQTWRALSVDGKILDESEMATGPRKTEMEGTAFNRDPIVPPKGSGTKNKPIEVPTMHGERVVGFEDPATHAMYWFNMSGDKLHYVPEIDKYFKLISA